MVNQESMQKVWILEASGGIQFPPNFLESYHTHIYCHSGEISFLFKGKEMVAKSGEFVFWYAHSAATNFRFSMNFTATVLLVDEDFLNSNLPDVSWSIDALLHTRDHPVLHFNERKNKQKVLDNFYLLYNTLQESDHTFYEELSNTQMHIFTMEMWHVFADEFDRQRRKIQSGSIYEQFIHLVQEHCMIHREVQFYADKLFISAKHLNFICKQNTGISASIWIQRFVTERLILLLENKNLGIAEIADMMEFSSRSFFTRYVKKQVGLTPTEYRLRLD